MIGIRLAELRDFDFFYDLKCEDSNIFWTGHGEKPERDNLLSFFAKAVEDADKPGTRKIYIVEDDGMKVGHLYITPENCGGGILNLQQQYRRSIGELVMRVMQLPWDLKKGKNWDFIR